jgi:hypothetical protein
MAGWTREQVAHDAAAVSKSDTTEVDFVGLYVGGTGDVVIATPRAPTTPVTFSGVPAGTILPVRVAKVMNATSATNIVGFKA